MIAGLYLGESTSDVILNSDSDYASYLYMDVDANSSLQSSEFINQKDGNRMLVFPHNVSIIDLDTYNQNRTFSEKFLYWALYFMNFLSLVIYIAIIVLFIWIMRVFIKSEVFNRKIVSLLGSIGWLFLVLGVLASLWNLLRIYLVSSEISMVGLEFTYRNVVDWSTIIIGLVVLVNTEIISQATAIKDENDLTI
ncbi:MAG: DUF2975 domain-containing protein [Candidatus Aphodosoma sp.]